MIINHHSKNMPRDKTLIKAQLLKHLLWLTVITTLVIICYFHIDRELANWSQTWAIPRAFRIHSRQSLIAIHQPVAIYLFSSLILCIGIVLRSIKPSKFADFIIILAVAIVASAALKVALKFIFSRHSERAFLSNSAHYGFHWFQNYQSFPSGHMMIPTAAMTAIWLYYKPLRILLILAGVVDASILIINFDHFLGDIIAGIYAGVITTLIIHHCYHYLCNQLKAALTDSAP